MQNKQSRASTNHQSPFSEVPLEESRLPHRVVNLLGRHGLDWEELRVTSDEELLALRGMGTSLLGIVRAAIPYEPPAAGSTADTPSVEMEASAFWYESGGFSIRTVSRRPFTHSVRQCL